MAMQDAQEKKGSRSMFKGSESSKIGQIMTAGVNFVPEGETNQVDWRTCMVADLVENIEPNPRWRSTFLTKREY
jgi:hypothetical protein